MTKSFSLLFLVACTFIIGSMSMMPSTTLHNEIKAELNNETKATLHNEIRAKLNNETKATLNNETEATLNNETKAILNNENNEKSSNFGLIRHMVFFRYKNDTSPSTVQNITNSFLALRHKCKRNGTSYIVSLDAGTANSLEKADLGLTHGFLVTFLNENDRDYYVGRLSAGQEGTAKLKDYNGKDLYDEEHEAFKLFVGPYLYSPEKPVVLDGPVGNGVFVFDFTSN